VTDDRQDRIRQRAHEIWDQAGRPEGAHQEHWEQATAEIDGGAAAKPKKAAKKADAKPAKAAAKPKAVKPAAAKSGKAKSK
jgi:hypothetical protein